MQKSEWRKNRMSELPEIESIVHFLKPHIVNRKIVEVILKKKIF